MEIPAFAGMTKSKAGMTMQKKNSSVFAGEFFYAYCGNAIARIAGTTYAKLYKSVMSSLFLSYIQNWLMCAYSSSTREILMLCLYSR